VVRSGGFLNLSSEEERGGWSGRRSSGVIGAWGATRYSIRSVKQEGGIFQKIYLVGTGD